MLPATLRGRVPQGGEEEAQHDEHLGEDLFGQGAQDGIPQGKEDGRREGQEAEERTWAAVGRRGEEEGVVIGCCEVLFF